MNATSQVTPGLVVHKAYYGAIVKCRERYRAVEVARAAHCHRCAGEIDDTDIRHYEGVEIAFRGTNHEELCGEDEECATHSEHRYDKLLTC